MNSLTVCQECLASCDYASPVTSDRLALFVFRQYQDFLEDLEEDEALRKNVNIYRGEQLHSAAASTQISAPQIIVSILTASNVKTRLVYRQSLSAPSVVTDTAATLVMTRRITSTLYLLSC